MLVDVARLEREYFERHPDLEDPTHLVSFGTSGHRGLSLHGTFTEAHVLSITQAICDYRRSEQRLKSWLRTMWRPYPAR
jgi:phosphoglucomutase